MASKLSEEQRLIERIKEIVSTHGKIHASQLIKNLERSCFITNRGTDNSFRTLDIQLFLLLAYSYSAKRKVVNLRKISALLNVSVDIIYKRLKRFVGLEFCFYDFHYRVFFENQTIFKYFDVTKQYLSFSVTNAFKNTILRKGRKLLLPISILKDRKTDKTSFSILAMLKIISNIKIQNLLRGNTKDSTQSNCNPFTLSFNLKELFLDCGINVASERLDNIRRWVAIICKSIDDWDRANIKIKAIDETELIMGEIEDFNENILSLTKLGRKNELMNSNLEITVF